MSVFVLLRDKIPQSRFISIMPGSPGETDFLFYKAYDIAYTEYIL